MKLDLPAHLVELNPHLVGGKGKRQKVQVGDGYKSALERRFVTEYLPIIPVSEWWYEPITLILKGGRYTPDFLIRNRLVLTFVEVKGYTKSLRADRRAFLEAARTHTWAQWLWLTWDKQAGWVEKWAAVMNHSR